MRSGGLSGRGWNRLRRRLEGRHNRNGCRGRDDNLLGRRERGTPDADAILTALYFEFGDTALVSERDQLANFVNVHNARVTKSASNASRELSSGGRPRQQSLHLGSPRHRDRRRSGGSPPEYRMEYARNRRPRIAAPVEAFDRAPGNETGLQTRRLFEKTDSIFIKSTRRARRGRMP